MSNEEIVLLYQENQNEEDRRELLSVLYKQNEAMIQKIANIYSGMAETADLMQEAYFGLLTAAERWEPDGGSTFASYAYTWIRQALRRYVDDSGGCIRIPVFRKEQVLQYKRYCADFQKDHGRRPNTKEITKALEISQEQLEEIRRADTMMLLSSLSSPVTDEDPDLTLEDTIPDPADPIRDAEERLQDEQLRQTIWKTVDDLGGRESAVIHKRFEEGKTLKECGADFGVSLDRARQIEAKALRRLRSGKYNKILQPFLEESAIRYGYGRAASLGAFRRTGESAVERAVLEAETALEWARKATERHRRDNTSIRGDFPI